jgi:hypothetical protein
MATLHSPTFPWFFFQETFSLLTYVTGIEIKSVEGFGGETWGERDQWGDPGVDGRILLTRIFRKYHVGVWTGLSWLRTETGGGHL